MPVILIGGGSRSGKSAHALELARARGSRLAFIATAQALDGEMQERIDRHRADRGDAFTTFEEPHSVARVIASQCAGFDAVVVDCLTLWLSNMMLSREHDVEAESRDLFEAAIRARAAVILVTNEVGCGIVPDNELARRFRDLAGSINRQAAEKASEVYWMVFGIPVKIK
ncbi:MAG: bifunctional adenosylcobinamide kinase/adenosylcobinamide-phosphate guanylyltransferase [Bryobacteraceae bacterium]